MKKKQIFLFCVLSFSSMFICASNNFVTWDWGGRTGDQLVCYCIAKWFSWYSKIPLLVKPFKYSKAFVFDDIEQKFDPKKAYNLFCTNIFSSHEIWNEFDTKIQENTIFPYSLDYNSSFLQVRDCSSNVKFNHMYYYFKKNKEFFEQLKASLQTKEPLQTLELSKNAISIAVHVRKGGGFDLPYKSDQFYSTIIDLSQYVTHFNNKTSIEANNRSRNLRNLAAPDLLHTSGAKVDGLDSVLPLKHPPDQYYIDQIKAIDRLLNLPLHVYIFTDDQQPEQIVMRYKQSLSSKNIMFFCRQEENHYDLNVLQDMFSMAKFDILIRSYSSFAQIAQLLGNHKLVVSPIHAMWQGNKLIIDEVLVQKSDNFDEFMQQFRQKFLS